MRHGRAKFLHYFPKGFRDSLYVDWERGYKWAAHERWIETLGQASFQKLLRAGKHREIAAQAVAIEARTIAFLIREDGTQGRDQVASGGPDLCSRSLRFPSWHT